MFLSKSQADVQCVVRDVNEGLVIVNVVSC